MQVLRLIVPLLVATGAVHCRSSQLDSSSLHQLLTQRGDTTCKTKGCELLGGACGNYTSKADCEGRLVADGCKGKHCKCCIPGNPDTLPSVGSEYCDGVIIGRVLKQCLTFSEDELSWLDAAVSCGKEGGRLAEIKHQPNVVLAYVTTYYHDVTFWAGASENDGIWEWLDTKPFYPNFPWGNGAPHNESGCLEVNVNKSFNDTNCNEKRRYICESAIPFPYRDLNFREDARCGNRYPALSGQPGICAGLYGCCSPFGYCGFTAAHCLCSRCVDYRDVPYNQNGQRRATASRNELDIYDRVNMTDIKSEKKREELMIDHEITEE